MRFIILDPQKAIKPNFFQRGLLAWALQLLHVRLSPHAFGLLHGCLRKLAHLTEYGIFALLLYGPPDEVGRSLWRPRRAALCILAALAYSLTDEFHPPIVPGSGGLWTMRQSRMATARATGVSGTFLFS